MVGTTADYLRFCTMLAGGGALDGRRVLSRKTIELMTTNHLPGDGDMSDFALPMGYGEVGFAGNGFGLTVAVSKGPQASGTVGSAGTFMWGGAASTTFWVDPSEELAVVFMTQLLPSGTFNFRGPAAVAGVRRAALTDPARRPDHGRLARVYAARGPRSSGDQR